MKDKKYYKIIDLVRVISCIGILLYHMGILKGGYLAVCTFFALSGYLSYIKSAKKDFSILEYYKKRLLTIYLPLLFVVFITIFMISIFDMNWLNLKPETTSVLFSYNNFWQLSANMDYFAHHIDSPFMHLWYISILIQFDLISPIIYKILNKIKNKTNKVLPLIILILLSISSIIYFYISSVNNNIMYTYYNTLTRSFSLILGILFGYIHINYKTYIPFKNKDINKTIFCTYLILFVMLMLFIDASNIYFNIIMILVSLISCRLIDYAINISNKNINIFDKVIKYIGSISYEIYLIQYPVIFMFQNVDIKYTIPICIVIIILLSMLLHYVLDFKNNKFKTLKHIVFSILIIITLVGVYD